MKKVYHILFLFVWIVVLILVGLVFMNRPDCFASLNEDPNMKLVIILAVIAVALKIASKVSK